MLIFTSELGGRQCALMMPLFGKKDSTKKVKKDGKDSERGPQLEDKFEMKDVLGT